MGGGLFIGNLNDVEWVIMELTPFIREVYREKQIYTY
jgi:hypothetical protein